MLRVCISLYTWFPFSLMLHFHLEIVWQTNAAHWESLITIKMLKNTNLWTNQMSFWNELYVWAQQFISLSLESSQLLQSDFPTHGLVFFTDSCIFFFKFKNFVFNGCQSVYVFVFVSFCRSWYSRLVVRIDFRWLFVVTTRRKTLGCFPDNLIKILAVNVRTTDGND